MSHWVRSLALSASAALSGGTVIGAATGIVAGCQFEPTGIAADGGGPMPDAGLDAVQDAPSAIVISGDQYIPSPTVPVEGTLLSSPWALFSWNSGMIPEGRTADGFGLCSTTGALSTIDGPEECPSPVHAESVAGTNNYYVKVPAAAGATHLWKIRAHYRTGQEDLGEVSEYSAVRTFLTDNSTVFWLRLDEGAGTSAADFIGTANTFTLQNGTSWTAAGVSGSAIVLDGEDDHGVGSNAGIFNFGTEDFTLSTWVYLESLVGAQAIFDKRVSTNGYEFYALNGALEFYGVGCGYVARSAVMTPNAWHHAAVTRQGSTITIYLDGEPSGTGNCADNFSNTAQLSLGCNSPPEITCQEALHGRIDEPSVRTGAVPAETIRNDFRAGAALLGILP